MFKRVDTPSAEAVRMSFDGREILARPGDSVAAALLSAGVLDLRDTPVTGAPRAPYCMMGACFECLVEIDGVANRQACMTQVSAGMAVRRQRGVGEVGEDEPGHGD